MRLAREELLFGLEKTVGREVTGLEPVDLRKFFLICLVNSVKLFDIAPKLARGDDEEVDDVAVAILLFVAELIVIGLFEGSWENCWGLFVDGKNGWIFEGLVKLVNEGAVGTFIKDTPEPDWADPVLASFLPWSIY